MTTNELKKQLEAEAVGGWKYTQPPEGQRVLVMLKPSGFFLYAKRKGAMIYPILYKNRTYGLEAVRAWRVPDEPL